MVQKRDKKEQAEASSYRDGLTGECVVGKED